mgnify:CR=1 FL=1
MFADQTDVNWIPPIGSQWADIARQPRVPTPGVNQKRYVFGAADVHFGRVLWRVARRKRSREFCKFLRQLLREMPDERIVLIVDNYSIHKTAAVDKVVQEAEGRLTLVFLPTYSPWLNSIELLWRHAVRAVLNNHFYPSLKATLRAVWAAFTQLAQRPDLVLQVLGADTKHLQALT